MDRKIVVRLHASFEEMMQRDASTSTEFWNARDLQMLLGYARWENFAKVIDKAITACENSGHDPKDHFLGITKMVDLGSGSKRQIEDIALTRLKTPLPLPKPTLPSRPANRKSLNNGWPRRKGSAPAKNSQNQKRSFPVLFLTGYETTRVLPSLEVKGTRHFLADVPRRK